MAQRAAVAAAQAEARNAVANAAQAARESDAAIAAQAAADLERSRNSRRAAREESAVRISRAQAEVLAGQRLQQQNILDCTGDCYSSVLQFIRRADAISTDVRRGRQEPGTCAVPPTAAAIAYANDAEKEWHQRHIAMRYYAAAPYDYAKTTPFMDAHAARTIYRDMMETVNNMKVEAKDAPQQPPMAKRARTDVGAACGGAGAAAADAQSAVITDLSGDVAH